MTIKKPVRNVFDQTFTYSWWIFMKLILLSHLLQTVASEPQALYKGQVGVVKAHVCVFYSAAGSPAGRRFYWSAIDSEIIRWADSFWETVLSLCILAWVFDDRCRQRFACVPRGEPITRIPVYVSPMFNKPLKSVYGDTIVCQYVAVLFYQYCRSLDWFDIFVNVHLNDM